MSCDTIRPLGRKFKETKRGACCCICWGAERRKVGYILSLRITLRGRAAQRQVTASASQLVTLRALLSQRKRGSVVLAGETEIEWMKVWKQWSRVSVCVCVCLCVNNICITSPPRHPSSVKQTLFKASLYCKFTIFCSSVLCKSVTALQGDSSTFLLCCSFLYSLLPLNQLCLFGPCSNAALISTHSS